MKPRRIQPIPVSDVFKEFRKNQELISREEIKREDITVGFNNKPPKKSKPSLYERYKYKLDRGNIDKFSTRDIMFYFRDIAKQNGIKYVIANPNKDMRQYRILKDKGYSTEDILAMIEFLFSSNQDYLDKNRLSPNVLVSSWCNTIYADTQLWLEDKFVPKNIKKHSKREWTEKVSKEEKAEIGEWGF